MTGILYAQLALMMFLQFAIWAAWAPGLAAHLCEGLGFSAARARWASAALCIPFILAPLLGGQLADRWLASEYLLAAAHLAGSVLLLAAARARAARGLIGLLIIYAILYAPTLALANALMFRCLTDAAAEAGGIRVWGAIGWLALFLVRPSAAPGRGRAAGGYAASLALAGGLSLLMGVASLFLPHTPPLGRPTAPLACRAALAFLGRPDVLAFILVAFVVSVQASLHDAAAEPFLRDAGVRPRHVCGVMAIAPAGEAAAIALLLPLLLPRVDYKWALAAGVLAWPILFLLTAIARTGWLAIAAMPFRGIGCALLFFAGQVWVDSVAPPDIRASAQALVTVATLGLGSFAGTHFASAVINFFRFEGTYRWRPIFLIPCILTLACAIAFLALFHG